MKWGGMTRIDKTAYMAQGAVVVGDVQLGAQSSVWHNAVLRGDVAPIAVGANSNVQDCAVLHGAAGFPVVVGDGVTIGRALAIVGNGARFAKHGTIAFGCRVVEHPLERPASVGNAGGCVNASRHGDGNALVVE